MNDKMSKFLINTRRPIIHGIIQNIIHICLDYSGYYSHLLIFTTRYTYEY